MGFRLARQWRLRVIPGPRNHDQQTVAQGPEEVGPCPLLIMAGGLIGERGIENDSMNDQEAAHAQKERSFSSMVTQQASNQKTQGDQAKEQNPRMKRTDLHRMASHLPARGHVDLRQFDRQRQRADLHKIAEAQPAVSAARVPRTQKQRHGGGHDPEKDQHIAGPQRAQRGVHIVVIVGVESLASGGQQAGESDETPDALAKGSGLARNHPADHRGDQRRRGVDPVAPQRCRRAAVAERQHRPMHQHEGSRRR